MDISVSRLNHRLALQLPKQLPLGLVFVLGRVSDLQLNHDIDANGWWGAFMLREEEHQLRCQLTKRAAADLQLREGDKIRAGGHLVFDPLRADYFLLVRDVEIVRDPPQVTSTPRPERSELGSVLADIRKRAEATQLERADLPLWVKRIAPPEVRAEMDMVAEDDMETAVSPNSAPRDDPLDEKLVTFAAKAMESGEDVELTPELLERLAPDRTDKRRSRIGPTAAADDAASALTGADTAQTADSYLILLLIATLIFLIASMIAVVLLWL